MKLLIIINGAPSGTEKAYNALRISNQISKNYSETELYLFLMADGVNCAITDQNTPNGYYNIGRMLRLSLNKGAKLKLCGSCVSARGLQDINLIEKAEISSMFELTKLIHECDKVPNLLTDYTFNYNS